MSVRDLRHHYLPRGVAARGALQPEPAESALNFGSFDVSAGSILLVRGASGAGKSTLLHLLAGVLPVTTAAGLVLIAAREVSGLPTRARDHLRPFVVGWMPQRLCLIESLTVRENVLLPLALAGRSNAAGALRANELMRALQIETLAGRRPAAISVGQAARVSLARALVAQPKLLLADEPTAALDAASANLVARAIAVFASLGGAAVVASHDAQLRDMLDRHLPPVPVATLELPQ